VSLQIDMAKITRVLLADGWHDCQGISLDAYEFGVYYRDRDYGSGWGFDMHHGGGQDGVCAGGFAFTDKATGATIAGPLTAILAVAGPGITADPEPDDPGARGARQPSTSA